jgi:hypothetical protein
MSSSRSTRSSTAAAAASREAAAPAIASITSRSQERRTANISEGERTSRSKTKGTGGNRFAPLRSPSPEEAAPGELTETLALFPAQTASPSLQQIREAIASAASIQTGTVTTWPSSGGISTLPVASAPTGSKDGVVSSTATSSQVAPFPSASAMPFVRLEELKNKYKGEGGATLDAWISYTRRLLALNEGQLSDSRSVTWLSTGLEGAALQWFEQRHDTVPFASAKDLYTELRLRFQPINAAETARHELKTLRQGKGSVDDYLLRFRQLVASLPKLDEETRIFFFTEGLKEELQERLSTAMPPPSTLEETAAFAARLESRSRRMRGAESAANAEIQGNNGPLYTQEQLNAILAAHSANSAKNSQQGQLPSQQAPAYDSRVNRGANKRGSKEPWLQIPGMTKELWERRSQANQCRWCGSGEHRMYDCHERTSKRPPRLN